MKKNGYDFTQDEDDTEAQRMIKKQKLKRKALQGMYDESRDADKEHVRYLNDMINSTEDEEELQRLERRRDKFLKIKR